MSIMLYTAVIAALLLFPQSSASAAWDALCIWGLHVVPSLFPYMVFSRMLAQRLALTSLPAWLSCLMLGLLGGSPSGAAVVSAYRARLSGKAALILTALTGTISPMFFLGTVCSWTGDPLLCRKLLVCQYSGAALTALCAALTLHPERKTLTANQSAYQSAPLRQSIDAMLQIGGCIITCSVPAALIKRIPGLPQTLTAVIHALLEVSGGIHAMTQLSLSPAARSLLLAAASGFGGISILAQNLIFTRQLGIHAGMLLLLSTLRAFFSSAVMLLLP